jgi:hypothetical protein
LNIDPEILSSVDRTEEYKETDPYEYVRQIAASDYRENLKTRNDVFDALNSRDAALFLPLPPHITEYFWNSIQEGFVYHTDYASGSSRHFPHAPGIDLKDIPHVIQVLQDIDSILLEGKIEQGQVLLRSITLNMVSHLSKQKLRTLYVHNLHHSPRGTRLFPFFLKDHDVDMRRFQ